MWFWNYAVNAVCRFQKILFDLRAMAILTRLFGPPSYFFYRVCACDVSTCLCSLCRKHHGGKSTSGKRPRGSFYPIAGTLGRKCVRVKKGADDRVTDDTLDSRPRLSSLHNLLFFAHILIPSPKKSKSWDAEMPKLGKWISLCHSLCIRVHFPLKTHSSARATSVLDSSRS